MNAPTSAIESVPPSEAIQKAARVSGMAGYEALCAEAEKDYEGYWARLARENVVWSKPFTQVLDESNAPFYRWFADGELNASANCLDKHMGTPTEHRRPSFLRLTMGKSPRSATVSCWSVWRSLPMV